MSKNAAPVRLGIFIFLGFLLFVIGIFMIGKRGAIFGSSFKVKANFSNVQGLRNGALVRLNGIDVGSVASIKIVPDTTGRVEVTMNLSEDIKRFIRTDTKATIETEGLVGNKVVVLEPGSSSTDMVSDGGYIQTKEQPSFSALLDETQGVVQYTKEMTKSLAEITEKVNNGEGSIGKLLNDNKLYNNAADLTLQATASLKGITKELEKVTGLFDKLGVGVEKVVDNVNSTTGKLDSIMAGVQQGKGILGQVLVNGSKYDSIFAVTMQNINTTSEAARLAASRMAENMEALKHNWLFKGYFENRGYWDKAEYEDEINNNLKELDVKMKLINKKIDELKKLEGKNKQ
ncbi:MAG: MlaD family protein [Ignavibacteriaceae bacterium]|jgi:phospholipid/cholesterol/gamma-HCH transport system substrate-binding protein